ncbi:MAG TPA: glycoside hydrolase family 15 protein [Casimicrobiaceae bacterium]|nr:glycoside hydrolase family 15 protein [Casimicrobiaceae bacterium]
MPPSIEDYALIGNTRAAGLVGRDGSIDWLCLPRFDSAACFAALLGAPDNGRWLLAPQGSPARVRRRYRPDTLVLETEFETAEGSVRLVDCMPIWTDRSEVVRFVEGVSGRVAMRMELLIRFGYGAVVPWVRRLNGALVATAGPDSLRLRTSVEVRGEGLTTVAAFSVAAGERVPFVLTHFMSHQEPPVPIDPDAAVEATGRAWREWAGRCTYDGGWQEAVTESLVVLKGLTYAPTGGIVAAPTTSLPECFGQTRNWDYRFCWLRDATFTLYALLLAGYHDEAAAWREWLLRAAAGRPHDIQTLYGVAGERDLPERTLDWLAGYAGSRPVRVGNAASAQLQLDVFGEIMDTLHVARTAGLDPDDAAWQLQRVLLDFLESIWPQPDNGIWEIRGPRQHFTHSKMMAWVAFDRAVKGVERMKLDGPVERWRALCRQIRDEICTRGYDAERGTFVQHYGAKHTDASLLLMPVVGFLPARDPRVQGTVRAVERELMVDGLVLRYPTETGVDGLPPGEGVFLPCSFWLADNYALAGRREEASALFERLLALRNDVGLLAEEYDPRSKRMLGNFPQAFTHVGLVNTACNLSRGVGPGAHRGQDSDEPPPGSEPKRTRRAAAPSLAPTQKPAAVHSAAHRTRATRS